MWIFKRDRHSNDTGPQKSPDGQENEISSPPPPEALTNPLIRFETRPPSNQVMADVFRDRWASDLSELLGVTGSGSARLFTEDKRPELAAAALGDSGSISGFNVLEIGPLEAAHSYLLEQLGADVTAVESSVEAFLKCLIVKELLSLRCKFHLGDAIGYLESSEDRYDLIFCSGVLYHMSDPVQLIRRICEHTDRCFVWTHYYSKDRHPVEFEPVPYSLEGYRGTYWSHNYGNRSNQFWGGNSQGSVWMEPDDLLKAFAHFGLTKTEILDKQPDHPNGPSFTFVASRVS